ncbi:MAG: hypothetical protein WCA46_19845 [Actinocatenispora sp.]
MSQVVGRLAGGAVGVLGGLLVARPRMVAGHGGQIPAGAVRLLGLRCLVQGVLACVSPGPRTLRLAASLDASMLALAAADPRHRRTALTSAVIAATCVTAEALRAWETPPPDQPAAGPHPTGGSLSARQIAEVSARRCGA